MWLKQPLPGQAGGQLWAQRCWEHVMPGLLGQQERERQRDGDWAHGTGGTPTAATNTALGTPQQLPTGRTPVGSP